MAADAVARLSNGAAEFPEEWVRMSVDCKNGRKAADFAFGTRFAKERAMTTATSLLNHRSRAQARGFSLIEVLVAVAIVTLVSVAVGIAAYKHWVDSQRKTAFNEARTVRQAVKARQLEKDSCPTFAMLIEDGALDEDSPKQDPWGNPWRIRCDGTRVIVETDGPDRQHGTEDDVRVPAPEGPKISPNAEG